MRSIRGTPRGCGSVTWTLLGVHTAHILTDFLDSLVLAVLMFVGPLEEKRFVDVSENAMYGTSSS